MDFEIPCDTYTRLAEVVGVRDDDQRKYLNSIYLERRNNIVVAIATNVKIAVIEKICDQNGPDESVAIAIDNKLLLQCSTEHPFGGKLTITNNSMLGFVSAKTTLGYSFPGNIGVPLPDEHEFSGWRNWFPDELPKKTNGCMLMDAYAVAQIHNASISGSVRFPKFIDTEKPVVVRDDRALHWFALFFPAPDDNTSVSFGEIPDWCR